MSDSILIYRDLGDTLYVIDPDTLPQTNDLKPIMYIVAAVINAGYDGVQVDEKRLANGRYFQAVNVNLATPEGQLISKLNVVPEEELPTPQSLVDKIRVLYEQCSL